MATPVDELLEQFAKSYNVTRNYGGHFDWHNIVSVDFLKGTKADVLYLDYLVCSEPRHGWGKLVMDELCVLADRHQITMWLEVKPIPSHPWLAAPLNEEQLIAWYERFGFVREVFTNSLGITRRDLGGFVDMIRLPLKKGLFQ